MPFLPVETGAVRSTLFSYHEPVFLFLDPSPRCLDAKSGLVSSMKFELPTAMLSVQQLSRLFPLVMAS
jgi:hypothetical protein